MQCFDSMTNHPQRNMKRKFLTWFLTLPKSSVKVDSSETWTLSKRGCTVFRFYDKPSSEKHEEKISNMISNTANRTFGTAWPFFLSRLRTLFKLSSTYQTGQQRITRVPQWHLGFKQRWMPHFKMKRISHWMLSMDMIKDYPVYWITLSFLNCPSRGLVRIISYWSSVTTGNLKYLHLFIRKCILL